jgi:hypothetical protein
MTDDLRCPVAKALSGVFPIGIGTSSLLELAVLPYFFSKIRAS